MNKKKLQPPDWYPLPIYSAELTEEQWVTAIWMRVGFAAAYENHKSGRRTGLKLSADSTPAEAFKSVIEDMPPDKCGLIGEKDVDQAWPIKPMTWFEVEYFAHLLRPHMNAMEKKWAKRLGGDDYRKWIHNFHETGAQAELSKKSNRTIGDHPDRRKSRPISDSHRAVVGTSLPLMVNVNMDDESLRQAFDIWLAGIRDTAGLEQKKWIGEKDFAKWKKFGLLQAFDLSMWSELTNADYTDVFISHTIWPEIPVDDGFVDRTERYRKVTKKLVDRVFTSWQAERLTHQAKLGRFLETIKTKSGKKRLQNRSGS